MNAQELATVLLIMRIIATIILTVVIFKQIKQMRTTATKYPAVRIAVHVLTIVLFAGQFIPILLDAIVAFGDSYAGRSATPNLLGASYALNNAGKDIIIGALLAFIHFPPKHHR